MHVTNRKPWATTMWFHIARDSSSSSATNQEFGASWRAHTHFNIVAKYFCSFHHRLDPYKSILLFWLLVLSQSLFLFDSLYVFFTSIRLLPSHRSLIDHIFISYIWHARHRWLTPSKALKKKSKSVFRFNLWINIDNDKNSKHLCVMNGVGNIVSNKRKSFNNSSHSQQ